MKNKKSKKNSMLFYKILSFILIVISVFTISIILYFEVLPINYLIPIIIVLSIIIFTISYKLNKRTTLFTKLVMSLFSFILIIIESLGIFYAIGTIDFLNKIFDTGYRAEVYNLYVLKDNNYNNIKDLKNKNISFYKQDNESYNDAISKLKGKVTYKEVLIDSISQGVDNLINKETDALFISETLMDIYQEDHHDQYNNLKIIDSITVLSKSEKTFKSVNVTKKSFVVYLSGSDLTGKIEKVSRSDVNIIAVVNPDLGKVLLINTPRDYYVTLATKNAKDKLTHAGIYGIEESALTLGKLYQIDINYYARVNFTSFVKIIDTLNGITINSQYAFSYDGYSFKKGINELTGAKALAFSRGRSMLPQGDLSRGENQQAVITGIINKLSDKKILIKYNTLLNSLKSGVMTNIDKNIITKIVNMQLKENIKWEVETYNVTGTNSSDTTYSTGNSKVYVMEPDADKLSEAKIKIKDLMQN
ncbi:MAG: LCP family protein [Bacilli bacterium]|nr:LCP family protein [Bacilli bacterium]MDD4406843.1 LCP family protein [Bacilli bacterium]